MVLTTVKLLNSDPGPLATSPSSLPRLPLLTMCTRKPPDKEMAEGSFVRAAGCAGILVVIIVSSFLLGFSFYVIEPNFVGVDYNRVSQKIDDVKLYESGRFFLGKNFCS